MVETDPDELGLMIAPGPVHAMVVVDDAILRRLGTMIRHLCVGMIDEAVQVKVLSRTSPSAAGELIGPSNVLTLQRKWLPWTRRALIERLTEILAEARPQVLHCMSADLAHWVFPAAASSNVAILVHLMDLQDIRDFGRLAAYPHVFAATNTSTVERALLKAHPEMEGRVTTVPFGIPSVDEIACYAHPDQVPAVIITSSLEHGSGLELALKALRSIAQTDQAVHAFVLSEGGAEPAFRRQLDRLGLRSLVTFAGEMRDSQSLRNAMSASDLYLMPVPPERFNAHTLLAMSTGLAVLAPTGTIDDYLIDGQTAQLFEPRVSDLAEKWQLLLQDTERAKSLARGAQEYVRSYHKASFMVCAIAVLYRQALTRLKTVAAGAIANA